MTTEVQDRMAHARAAWKGHKRPNKAELIDRRAQVGLLFLEGRTRAEIAVETRLCASVVSKYIRAELVELAKAEGEALEPKRRMRVMELEALKARLERRLPAAAKTTEQVEIEREIRRTIRDLCLLEGLIAPPAVAVQQQTMTLVVKYESPTPLLAPTADVVSCQS